MSRREKRELRRANKKGLFQEIKEEAAAAVELTKAEQALEDQEIAWIQTRAKLQRSIEEFKNSSKDENLSNKEKLENLNKAIALTKELTDKEVEFAKERARISNERTIQGNSTRDELRANQELQAAAAEAEAAGLKLTKAILSERFSLIKQSAAEEQQLKDEIEKERAAKELEAAKARAAADLAVLKGMLIDKEALKLQSANLTADEIASIEAGAAAVSLELEELTSDQKLELAAGFAGNIAAIFGKNTAIGKAAAIAETTINTYRAATSAYASLAGVPVVGPVLGIAAAAAAIAAGLANVKKIIAVKVPGGGGGGSAPTAISSSAPAHRVFSSTVGSSSLTQPQLNQSQLNAVPNEGNMLTAADIANAVSKLPAPIVSVEAYENVSNAKKKIEVRANI